MALTFHGAIGARVCLYPGAACDDMPTTDPPPDYRTSQDRLLRRALLLVAGLLVMAVAAGGALVWWASQEQDHGALVRERRAVEAALRAETAYLGALAAAEAARPPSLYPTPAEPGWAQMQVVAGSDMTEGRIDGVAIVGPDGRVAYALGRGGKPVPLGQIQEEIAPLLRAAQAELPVRSRSSGITLWQGMPAIGVVVPMQGDDATDIWLVYVEQFDAALLAQLAADHFLDDLHLGGSIRDDVGYPLVDRSGRVLANLAWQPFRPGAMLMRDARPAVLVCAMILACLAATLFLYLRHAMGLVRRSEARALRDSLTGLPNRLLLEDRLGQVLHATRRGGSAALLYLDLDGFKAVNDTFGHATGDLLLQAVAARLESLVRRGDTVGRLGGDEFLIIQPGIDQERAVAPCCQRVLEAIAQPFVIEGRAVSIGVTIGVVIAPADGDAADTLLRRADQALYDAKRAGGRHCRRYREAAPASVLATSEPMDSG